MEVLDGRVRTGADVGGYGEQLADGGVEPEAGCWASVCDEH